MFVFYLNCHNYSLVIAAAYGLQISAVLYPTDSMLSTGDRALLMITYSVYLRQATCFYKLNYMKLELMLMDSIKLLIKIILISCLVCF